MAEQTPVDRNGPLWLAWVEYQQTEDYANSRRWALHHNADAHKHVDGALWDAFARGFAVATLLRATTPAPVRAEET